MECYLSFALLPEGSPLPPPALEEFWRSGDGQRGGEGADGNHGYANGGGGGGGSGFTESRHLRSPAPVEVFEALRVVGRAGGGEGADGLIPHGLQRMVVLCMAQRYPDTMEKMVQRRVQILSRISSLVGTFDDSFWGLRRPGGAAAGAGVETVRRRGDGEVLDVIPSGLLGSRRPGPPNHGYGGFSRYDYLLASWDALPSPHTLTSAAARYVSSVRAACQAAAVATAATSDGGGAASGGGGADAAARGGWAAARALASAADLQALADARPEAIRTYGEACALLAAEAARTAKVAGVPQKERAARDEHHKVASKMQELAGLAAQLGKEAPAIRLLQRAVEMHLSALEASGVLVPRFAGVNEHRAKLGKPDAEEVAVAAAAAEEAHGRGAGITYRAVVDDARPIASRLWLQTSAGVGHRPASGRSGGGGGGNLPVFGRLDVVGTCVGDLGLVLACTRTLQQEQKVEESVQLAEKVYPVLKEILGADHAFTKTALAAFVGQGIVDECWSHPDVEGSGGPALPSPTSRRRLARSSGGRGVGVSAAGIAAGSLGGGSGGGRGGSAAQYATGSSLVALTHSDLSVPPSPLPEEFYARYSSNAVNYVPNGGGIGHGDSGGDVSGGVGGGGAGAGGGGGGDRRSSRFSNHDSISSGTEGEDGYDSDGGALGPRRTGAAGGGAHNNNRGAFPRRTSHGREHSGGDEAAGGGGGGGGGQVGGGGALEPARSWMQRESYVQHTTRRARAHAYLITAATRARLKDETRKEALQKLVNQGRQEVARLSPDDTPQMSRLTMRR